MKHFIVRVPASTSNLGPGFDTLGLALDLYADFTVHQLERGPSRLEGASGGTAIRPEDCPFLPMLEQVFALAGVPPKPVAVQVAGDAPIGMGLGWSAAARVGGALAANALLGMPFTREYLLGPLIAAEGHPDNVTPSVLGGLTVTAQTDNGPLWRVYEPAPAWRVALLIPDYPLPTHEARRALPRKVAMAEAVFNISRLPLVIDGLVRGDAALLGRVMEDRLHEPYRAGLIRRHDKIRKAARRAGAAATFISGAGPALGAFCTGEKEARQVVAAMLAATLDADFHARGHVLAPQHEGARIAELE